MNVVAFGVYKYVLEPYSSTCVKINNVHLQMLL